MRASYLHGACCATLLAVTSATAEVPVETELRKIVAPEARPGQGFGGSIELRLPLMVVGARGDDAEGEGAGAAHLLRELDGTWESIARLDDPRAGDRGDSLGFSVCFVREDLVAASAPWDLVQDVGRGTVQLFPEATGWERTQRMMAPPLQGDFRYGNDSLGQSMDCSEDWIVAGAPQASRFYQSEGYVSFFGFDGSLWRHRFRFHPIEPEPWYRTGLGLGVAIGADLAVAASPGRQLLTFYRLGTDGWEIEGQVQVPIDGYEIDLRGDLLAVGAMYGQSGPPGPADSGEVWVYRRIDGVWAPEARLKSDIPRSFGAFGTSLVLGDDLLAVGEANTYHGGRDHGAVHVFRFEGGAWIRDRILLASDGFADQSFGAAVEMEGRRVMVGATNDDELGEGTGALYEFLLPLRIGVDPWPRWDGDRLDPTRPGLLPVALLGSGDFDPAGVDDASVLLRPGDARPIALFRARDLNGDGWPDRTALFRIQDTGIAPGDERICLSGTLDERSDRFEGCAPIETVQGCGRGQELTWALPPLALMRRRAGARARSGGARPASPRG